MPVRSGAQRASRRSFSARAAAPLLVAVLCALVFQLAPGSTASRSVHADSVAAPKAVFIVGPANGLTDSNLAESEKMATQAEAAGMDVRRVFFPNATWDNVLANIQDANFVVYMGHGYGWPSPYTTELTESRQDGMGLNTYAGSGKSQYTYYGATRLRESIHLAPNAIVLLNHLCYSAGNGEPGSAIPGEDLARQRVDNMASGWLAVGARTVFAYGWWQKLNYPLALMTTDSTMDQLFMTSGGGSPGGYVGWHDNRLDSERTPGAMIHLDPHPSYGYYRAVTGNLDMTAAEFRSTATGTGSSAPPPPDPSAPPEITSFSASDGTPGGTGVTAGDPVSFHPNGDGLDEDLVLTHTVTKGAYLDATITDASGQTARMYTVWSARGTSTSRWNGKNDAGAYVADGTYTITYVPRDPAGATGPPVSTTALVLTAIKIGKPAPIALFARDADTLAAKTNLTVTLNQPARITWQLLDATGSRVRSVRSDSSLGAGPLVFAWDGRADDGAWVPDGWYRSVVMAQTALGSYTQEQLVYVGAFRMTSSTGAPARGGKLTLTIVTTEPLMSAPRVSVTQPGVAPWEAATKKVAKKRYKVTLTLDSGGDAGEVEFLVLGIDKRGGTQQTGLTLLLR